MLLDTRLELALYLLAALLVELLELFKLELLLGVTERLAEEVRLVDRLKRLEEVEEWDERHGPPPRQI